MPAIIINLLKAIWKALLLLGQFLVILFLGLVAAILYALPWLLRLACIVVWLVGGYLAIEAIQKIYGTYSPSGAVLALQFAIIFLMVAWAGTLLKASPKNVWGGLLLGGLLPAWITWQGIPWLFLEWQHADLFFRVLPPALFSLALIYITIRMRLLRNAQQLNLSEPAFTWFPEQLSRFRGK
jgi:hypothetical protein